MTSLPSSTKLDALRWALSAGVVIAIHAVAFAALVTDDAPEVADEPSAAMVVEFAEIPVAAANLPAMIAPGPEQIEAKATPEPEKEPENEKETEEKPDPAVNPEVALQSQPKKEVEEVTEKSQLPAPITSAPQALAEKVASVAAAPRQGVPNRNASNNLPRWTNKISLLLERNKRYPQVAREHREQGVAYVSFSIDRDGHLLGGQIQQSSGHPLLDDEALAMLRRAQPFPPVPAEVSGVKVSLTVPIRFDIQKGASR